MFRKSKKLDDPPKVMSMQEIQEDLETFKHSTINIREQVFSDLKAREDLDNLNLNEWWDAFELNEKQLEELQNLEKRLTDIRNDLQEYATTEVQQGRNLLIKEIEDNLKRIRQIKTPE